MELGRIDCSGDAGRGDCQELREVSETTAAIIIVVLFALVFAALTVRLLDRTNREKD